MKSIMSLAHLLVLALIGHLGLCQTSISDEELQQIDDLIANGTQNYAKAFELFATSFGKNYSSTSEKIERFSLFTNNSNFINEINEKYNNKTLLFRAGINYFGDMTTEEVVANFTGYIPNNDTETSTSSPLSLGASLGYYTPRGGVPASFNMTGTPKVGPVQSQGTCGSCWSFSTVSSLSGQIANRTNKFVALSQQNLIDCDVGRGNNGCGGGSMTVAFDFIQRNGGIASAAAYPYAQGQGQCQNKGVAANSQIRGYTLIRENNENDLMDATYHIGPISVALNGSPQSFTFYKSGIYSDPSCNPQALDHAVVTVGFGSENGQNYWLLQNQWGPNWGENGFMRLARGSNVCGIVTAAPVYPNLVGS